MEMPRFCEFCRLARGNGGCLPLPEACLAVIWELHASNLRFSLYWSGRRFALPLGLRYPPGWRRSAVLSGWCLLSPHFVRFVRPLPVPTEFETGRAWGRWTEVENRPNFDQPAEFGRNRCLHYIFTIFNSERVMFWRKKFVKMAGKPIEREMLVFAKNTVFWPKVRNTRRTWAKSDCNLRFLGDHV